MYDSNFHTFQNQCLQIKVHFCPSLINKLADTLALVSFFIVIVLESIGFITGSSL